MVENHREMQIDNGNCIFDNRYAATLGKAISLVADSAYCKYALLALYHGALKKYSVVNLHADAKKLIQENQVLYLMYLNKKVK